MMKFQGGISLTLVMPEIAQAISLVLICTDVLKTEIIGLFNFYDVVHHYFIVSLFLNTPLFLLELP
jgi:uncharacterized membrane protein YuzA (DUF378 family)